MWPAFAYQSVCHVGFAMNIFFVRGCTAASHLPPPNTRHASPSFGALRFVACRPHALMVFIPDRRMKKRHTRQVAGTRRAAAQLTNAHSRTLSSPKPSLSKWRKQRSIKSTLGAAASNNTAEASVASFTRRTTHIGIAVPYCC